jgi:hypothetical protein
MESDKDGSAGREISDEEREQLNALITMLEAVKYEPRDERLVQLMPILVQHLLQVYLSFYEWYVAIGAPGRSEPHEMVTRETFHRWLHEQTQPSFQQDHQQRSVSYFTR